MKNAVILNVVLAVAEGTPNCGIAATTGIEKPRETRDDFFEREFDKLEAVPQAPTFPRLSRSAPLTLSRTGQ